MSNDARKVSNLNITTTLSSNDRVVVLTNPSSFAQTQTIALSDFVYSFSSIISGPYANDSVANTANLPIGSLYYNSNGSVQIRLT